MEHNQRPRNLIGALDCLASQLMGRINDFSIEPQARAIAHYMLDIKGFSLDYCVELLSKKNAPTFIRKLLKAESAFMGVTPRSIGIDLVVSLSRDAMQSSLNVKHLKVKQKFSNQMTRIEPEIKDRILYSHPQYIWVRYFISTDVPITLLQDENYTNNKKSKNSTDKTINLCGGNNNDDPAKENNQNDSGSDMETESTFSTSNSETDQHQRVYRPQSHIKITRGVYEVYIKKSRLTQDMSVILKNKRRILVRALDHEHKLSMIMKCIENAGGTLIFCSELILFMYNPQLFISNYVKFNYCYKSQNPVFELCSFRDYRLFNFFLMISMLFVDRKNLSIMADYTHGPLIKYTGDNPQKELGKCDANRYYTNEGTRATMSIDGSSDLGTFSNYIEIYGEIELNNDVLDNIE